jgi:hypothetical protein
MITISASWKHTIFSKLERITATTSYQGFWRAMIGLVILFVRLRIDQDLAVLKGTPPNEPPIQEMVKGCQKAMEGEVVDVSML